MKIHVRTKKQILFNLLLGICVCLLLNAVVQHNMKCNKNKFKSFFEKKLKVKVYKFCKPLRADKSCVNLIPIFSHLGYVFE